MDTTQTVSIPLSEYLSLKKLEEHEKEVIITEYTKRISGKDEVIGVSVSWKSDGKCWLYLASKLYSFGEEYTELIKKYKKIKKMSLFEFWKFKRKQ